MNDVYVLVSVKHLRLNSGKIIDKLNRQACREKPMLHWYVVSLNSTIPQWLYEYYISHTFWSTFLSKHYWYLSNYFCARKDPVSSNVARHPPGQTMGLLVFPLPKHRQPYQGIDILLVSGQSFLRYCLCWCFGVNLKCVQWFSWAKRF